MLQIGIAHTRSRSGDMGRRVEERERGKKTQARSYRCRIANQNDGSTPWCGEHKKRGVARRARSHTRAVTVEFGKTHDGDARGLPMSDDEDDEIEEDPRIGQLYSAADKKSPEEFAAYVDSLGTKDAIVFGGMCTDAPTARAHFVVMALIDLEDDPLPECLTARRKLLKAAVEKGPAGSGKELIAALEGLICTSDAVEGEAKEAAKSSFDKALKVLWEYEIVSEEEMKSWQADERAGRHYRVSAADAQRLHDLGRVFLEWVEQGEED